MRVPSELVEGEGQNLLGGVAMAAGGGSGAGPAGERRRHLELGAAASDSEAGLFHSS